LFGRGKRVADPSTVEDWLSLAAQHELAASLLIDNRKAAAQGWWHCGMAAEASIKAYILWSKRPTDWQAYAAKNGLRTHDLGKLLSHAGIGLSAGDPMAPSWHMMISWDHRQRYDPQRMPRIVAKNTYEATFGPSVAVTWIRSRLIAKG
jgi:hypothetical protein